MAQQEIIPHLFRTEYRKIISVLCRLFGIEHIEIAEDIVSDTFLVATELWSLKGLPENPTAWLYTVAKNKTKDYLKRDTLFAQKISCDLKYSAQEASEIQIDLTATNVIDSQLAMMFAICHPCISAEAQISLSLNLLCGFGADEIADALLTNREVVYKRLARAKEKLRQEKIEIVAPAEEEMEARLATVLTTLYLLFSEGYYSTSAKTTVRRELCVEALRLTYLLAENESTNKPDVNALLSLMCFHSSRFEARTKANGEIILYEHQDTKLWNQELIDKGKYFLEQASKTNSLGRYQVEAAIAYWHTRKEDSKQKWESILQLYNKLLQIEYSPIAALNRTYALAKVQGKEAAIMEAEKLLLTNNHLYFTLLGNLYTSINNIKAVQHYQSALQLAKTVADKVTIQNYIDVLTS